MILGKGWFLKKLLFWKHSDEKKNDEWAILTTGYFIQVFYIISCGVFVCVCVKSWDYVEYEYIAIVSRRRVL